MTIGAPIQVEQLAERVRVSLRSIAARGAPITYHDLAKVLQLTPPNRIHLMTEALALLIADDSNAGRPLIAAIAISKVPDGSPAPGFFDCAAHIGRFSQDAAGSEAWAFHAHEFHVAAASWTTSERHGEGRLKDPIGRV